MAFRALMLLTVLVVGLVLGQSNATGPIAQAFDQATGGDLLPKVFAFLGTLATISIGWAVVKVIRG